jgi:hypothetical protein
MEQQQRLEMVEFGVTGLADIRILLNRWKKVLVELGREEAPSVVWKTYRQVGVEVEDRRPGQEVLLTFLAPREVLERFLADLKKEAWRSLRNPSSPGWSSPVGSNPVTSSKGVV